MELWVWRMFIPEPLGTYWSALREVTDAGN
jgi:hypothetical protein